MFFSEKLFFEIWKMNLWNAKDMRHEKKNIFL